MMCRLMRAVKNVAVKKVRASRSWRCILKRFPLVSNIQTQKNIKTIGAAKYSSHVYAFDKILFFKPLSYIPLIT